jgi:predicted DCC family thiol-disulfide oxidoreductase YuxK
VADVTVYYDASCPLCRREIAIYRGRTDASFVDVSDPANAPPDLSPEEAMARFHVREDGRLLSGAAAFAALWRVTRGFRILGRIAALPGVRHILEAGYRGFLLVRPAVQRSVRRATCEPETCR